MSFTAIALSRRQSGLLALLLLTTPLFFWGGPEYTAAPLYRSVWNAGHILFFALVGALCATWLGSHLRRWLTASLLLLAISFVIEQIQTQVGRDFSLQDLFHNLTGFWLGAVWRQKANPARWALRFGVVLLITPQLWQISQDARLQWLAYSQFPVIAGFESTLELKHLEGQVYLQHTHRSQGQSALAVELTTERYSGISIDRLLGDWRTYKTFALDIYNPEPSALLMTLRIADKTHNHQYEDRFNQQLLVQAGWNTVSIAIEDIVNAPAKRQLDAQHIADITLFSVHTAAPRTIYIDHLRLE